MVPIKVTQPFICWLKDYQSKDALYKLRRDSFLKVWGRLEASYCYSFTPGYSPFTHWRHFQEKKLKKRDEHCKNTSSQIPEHLLNARPVLVHRAV